MKPTITRKTFSVAAIFAGLGWMIYILVPGFGAFFPGFDLGEDWLVFIIFLPALILPGLIFILSGVRLFRMADLSALRWIVGVVSIFGGIFGAAILEGYFGVDQLENFHLSGLSAIIVSIALFIPLTWLLLSPLEIDRSLDSALLSRGVAIVIGFAAWGSLYGLFKDLAEVIAPNLWGAAILIVSGLCANLVYMLVYQFLMRKEDRVPWPPQRKKRATHH